jgi:hypothetical protein
VEAVLGPDNDPARQTYVNQLILNSGRILAEANHFSDYFSLRSAAEQEFASDRMWVTLVDGGLSSPDMWRRVQADELGHCYIRYCPEVLEGLPLYLRKGSGFRVATTADTPYRELLKLLADAWSDFTVEDEPPAWATDLYIGRADLYLHDQFFRDLSTIDEQSRLETARGFRKRAFLQALENQRQPQSLKKHLKVLIDALPEIQNVLELNGDQIIKFVINTFARGEVTLYLEHDESGFWTPCGRAEQDRTLDDFGRSPFATAFHNGDWGGMDETPWRGLCVTPLDYDRIIETAKAFADQPSDPTANTRSNGAVEIYVDAENPHYSKKLAAAVSAWRALSLGQDKATKRHPKTLAIEWLKANAQAFGLVKIDGQLNEQGIEDIAKVVNWKPEGGAPKST